MKLLLSITLLLISTGVFSQSSGIIRTVGASSDTNFVRNVYERNDSLFQLLNGHEIHIGMLGGSGNGIYDGSGTLSENTTVDGDGNSLSFVNNSKVVIEGLDSVQIKGAIDADLSDTTKKVLMVAANGTVYKASASGVVYDTTDFRIVSGGGYDTVKLKNPPPKEYIAILSQEGTDAPTATIIKDDFGDITFAYDSEGTYILNSAGGQFTDQKTEIIPGYIDYINKTGVYYKCTSAGQIDIFSFSSFTDAASSLADGIIMGTAEWVIHIIVYP